MSASGERDGSRSLMWPTQRKYAAPSLTIRERVFVWGERTFLMGIINMTPDSFSGDGLGRNVDDAVAQAIAFEAAGADILDVGGESSRPGAQPLGGGEELDRVLPVLEAMRDATSLPISIDTYRAGVAERALWVGADLVNDISGLRADPEMAAVVAQLRAPVIAMHNQRDRPFGDVAGDIAAGFEASLAAADDAGIRPSKIVLDPGFGFGWKPHQNFEIVRRLPEFFRFQHPLLLGTSRKSSLGFLSSEPAERRTYATAASVALAIAAGADIVRVHDVKEMRQVAMVADAVTRKTRPNDG